MDRSGAHTLRPVSNPCDRLQYNRILLSKAGEVLQSYRVLTEMYFGVRDAQIDRFSHTLTLRQKASTGRNRALVCHLVRSIQVLPKNRLVSNPSAAFSKLDDSFSVS